MKLIKADKELLKSWGHPQEDLKQLEQATGVTRYTIKMPDGKEKRISTAKAIEILGRETYLSGISRSAFHFTCVRRNKEQDMTVHFDSSSLFK